MYVSTRKFARKYVLTRKGESMPKTKKNEVNPETGMVDGPYVYENHAKPKTRRDFLGLGLLGMSSYVVAPSLLSMLWSTRAAAEGCVDTSAGSGMMPFLCFDLAGGANIAGSNVIVGKAGGQEDFINNYTTLGLPGALSPRANAANINRDLGLLFHSSSGFLAGLMSVTTKATRDNLEGAVFCTALLDDINSNPINPMYWISKAGASGKLTSLVGSTPSISGGSSSIPASSFNPASRPVQINSAQDAKNLANLGRITEIFGAEKASKILIAAERMSSSQVDRFSKIDIGDQIKEMVRCGYIKSVDAAKFDSKLIDPAQDAQMAGLYNLAVPDQAQAATIAKLVIEGQVGAATILKPGYDYHTNNRTVGDAMDRIAGAAVGQALELAARKQKDLVIYVCTDGGVTSNGQVDGTGKGVWTADSGQRAASFMLVYRKDGRASVRNGKRQIGAYNDQGTVNSKFNRISESAETLTKVVVANYLALHGKEGELPNVIGKDEFRQDLDQYLVFEKKS
jgi:hypothetical protein